jgi:hypothetical protein
MEAIDWVKTEAMIYAEKNCRGGGGVTLQMSTRLEVFDMCGN